MPLSSIPTEPFDLLALYRADVARGTRLASQEEVSALIAQIATAMARRDHAGEHACKQRLVETHLELVIALVREHYRSVRRLDLLDLIQEGNLGLIRAVNDYAYDRDFGRFTSFACVCIRHALFDGLRAADQIMVSPIVFHQQRKRDPGFRERLREMQPLSLNQPFVNAQGEPHTLLDELTALPALSSSPHQDTTQTAVQKHAQVERLLAVLTPREQQVIRLLYGLDPTVACEPTYLGVARFLGRSSINAHRSRAMRKLRALVAVSPEKKPTPGTQQYGGARA